MSYELVISRDAMPELRALDLWLQEEVLDELEELTEDPPPVPGTRSYRMLRLRGGDVEMIFLRLAVDPTSGTITLLGITPDPDTI